MEQNNKHISGRFLTERDRVSLQRERKIRHRKKRQKKLLAFLAFLSGNGLLLYMIAGYRIDPCFGAGFAAAVSVYLGYQMHT